MAALLFSLLLLAGPAAAYASEAGDPAHHGSSGDAAALLLLGAASLVVAAATRRGRTTIALALALLVGVFGLEAAVHSVHHLADPQSAASCPLYAASQHTQSDISATPLSGAPTWTSAPAVALDLRPLVPLPAFSAHEGRAPPALRSA